MAVEMLHVPSEPQNSPLILNFPPRKHNELGNLSRNCFVSLTEKWVGLIMGVENMFHVSSEPRTPPLILKFPHPYDLTFGKMSMGLGKNSKLYLWSTYDYSIYRFPGLLPPYLGT